MRVMIILSMALLLFRCGPLPSETENSRYPIKLSLEERGRYNAEFSGAPILAIVETDTLVSYQDLHWHTGKGLFEYPDSMVGLKSKKFFVSLFWNAIPTHRDTGCDCFYDTVYVSVGGNFKISNTVKVDVLNTPPILDSVRIGNQAFAVQDTSYAYSVAASETTVTVKMIAHDLEQKTVFVSIIGDNNRMTITGSTPQIQTYHAPAGDFVDTVALMLYDQNGGQVVRTIMFNRGNVNSKPVIDSIAIGTRMLKGASSLYSASFRAFDTLQCRVYARDPQASDQLTITWSAGHRSNVIRSTLQDRIAYACASCKDTLDSAIVVDTLLVKAVDRGGDSAVKQIVIVKSPPPAIDSIQVGSTTLPNTKGTISAQLSGSTSYHVRIFTHNRENATVHAGWSLSAASRLTDTSDTAADYRSADSIYNDTIHIYAYDNNDSSACALVMRVTARTPVFDSIVIADSSRSKTFSASDSIYKYTALPTTNVTLTLFARYKGSRDSLSYTWKSTDTAKCGESKTSTVLFTTGSVSPDTDTVTIEAVKGTFTIRKHIVIITANEAQVSGPLPKSEKIEAVEPDRVAVRTARKEMA